MVSLLPGVDLLSEACVGRDKLVLDFIQACAEVEDFQIDVGPSTIDSIRTEYLRKTRFLCLLDGMVRLMLFVAGLKLSSQGARRLQGVDEEELGQRLYKIKRMIAVLAQARELYEQGPHIYHRARENGGLITDGRR